MSTSRKRSSRREFLGTGGLLAAAGALVPYWFTSAADDAADAQADRPRIGAIGVGNRGMYVTRWAAKFGPVVAVCDVDRQHAEKAKAAFDGKPDILGDYRKLLERKDVDVVVNATPDHWHTAINLAACRAGKDVYAEKPLTLTIDEGKLLCKVVEETGRIVQVGTMQRSEPQFRTAVELVRNGRIGRLRQIWVALPYYSSKGGPFPTRPVPPYLNWDVYQGQAPEHPYCLQRTHATFRWWYEYAGGMVTDWGNHHMDIAHWGMDCDLGGPASVEARGLFPNPPGPACYNTPDRFFARLLYPNGIEVLFFTSLNERQRMGSGDVGEHVETPPAQIDALFGKGVPDEIKTMKRNGVMFLGESGRVFVNRSGLYGKPADELKQNPLPAGAWRANSQGDHMANFFASVRTRKPPVATVEIEHRTVTACHLVNIALRLGRKIAWDAASQQIVGDQEANALQRRVQRTPYGVG